MLFFFCPWSADSEPLGSFLASCFKDPTRIQLSPSSREGFQFSTLEADKPEGWAWLALLDQLETVVQAVLTLQWHGGLTVQNSAKFIWYSWGRAGGALRTYYTWAKNLISPVVPWSSKGDHEVEENEDVGARNLFLTTEQWVLLCFSHGSNCSQRAYNRITHTLLPSWEPPHGNFRMQSFGVWGIWEDHSSKRDSIEKLGERPVLGWPLQARENASMCFSVFPQNQCKSFLMQKPCCLPLVLKTVLVLLPESLRGRRLNCY